MYIGGCQLYCFSRKWNPGYLEWNFRDFLYFQLNATALLYIAGRCSGFFRVVIFFFIFVHVTIGSADGASTTAQFNNPCGLVIDAPNVNLFVACWSGHTVRQVCARALLFSFPKIHNLFSP